MFTSLGRVHQVLREELEPTDGCCTQKHLFAIHSQENNSSSLSLPHGCSGSEKVEIEPYVLVHHEREGLQPARREICKGILLNCRIPTPVIAIEELPQKMLTYDSTVVLQPSENCIRDDLALEALIISTAAYAGRGIGASELRANNAAKVYLSICLGLQAAGVLSIQRVPALWIDIGDQAYKVRRWNLYLTFLSLVNLSQRFVSRRRQTNRLLMKIKASPRAATRSTEDLRRENSSRPVQPKEKSGVDL